MVSIIVPVYNVEQYLENCVESIINQTLRDIEIILVDDGSTDQSGEICDSYAKLDDRVKVIHKKNGGSTSARNSGLAIAQGEYVGFVDSDDWIEKEMYEKLYNAILKDDSDVVMALKYINKDGYEYINAHPVGEGVYDDSNNCELIENLIYSFDDEKEPISPSLYEKLFKKEHLLKYQLNVNEDIRIGEDGITVYSCVLNAERVSVINDALYHYRIRNGSICNSEEIEFFKIINNRYIELKNRCMGHKMEKSLMAQLNKDMLKFVFWGINSAFGFGYGTVIEQRIPPYEYLEKHNVKELILYGAGAAGQAYYKSFLLNRNYCIKAWVDKNPDRYADEKLPVEGVEKINELGEVPILIAVDDKNLAVRIKIELCEKGINEQRILYSSPVNFLNTI